jgi:ribosomal protein S18 acetylase RimI-like enzyme
VKIRPAAVGDLGRLLELYREPEGSYPGLRALEGEAAKRRFEEVLADAHQETLVAERGGEVVGTLVVAILPNLSHGGAPYAVVENVVVDAAVRGSGVGTALVRAAAEKARLAGAYKLTLSANAVRHRAHGFYEALGFEQTHLGFEIKP